ncbi:MAG: hypothetical protein RSB99_04335 [Bacilli bacterium]
MENVHITLLTSEKLSNKYNPVTTNVLPVSKIGIVSLAQTMLLSHVIELAALTTIVIVLELIPLLASAKLVSVRVIL